jgi:murein DD-endopeptidase MepM/ murein hydrolase activator NlpD
MAITAGLVVALIALSLVTYHFIFIHGARQGWPLVTPLAQLIAQAERSSQERYLKENLDAMARKLGELQARLVQIDSLGERVATLAGLPPTDARVRNGSGGALVMPEALTMDALRQSIDGLEQHAGDSADWLTVMETRLFDEKLRKSMVPTARPVKDVELGSGFGWRIDPLSGQRALHTGLDFPADVGTPILAAAGGVVVTQEFHPQYGNMVEVDHGNELVTRYAHASRVRVAKGDIVKRGQPIADVGSTGRSTGPHLHFEVWLAGVAQDPQKFLRAGDASTQVASGPGVRLPAPAPGPR